MFKVGAKIEEIYFACTHPLNPPLYFVKRGK
jgi:hypothetical protein